jgi:hypothetical protein
VKVQWTNHKDDTEISQLSARNCYSEMPVQQILKIMTSSTESTMYHYASWSVYEEVSEGIYLINTKLNFTNISMQLIKTKLPGYHLQSHK